MEHSRESVVSTPLNYNTMPNQKPRVQYNAMYKLAPDHVYIALPFSVFRVSTYTDREICISEGKPD